MKSRKGFTLVELMVVVVIVALLAALLIPMLTARVEAARWSEGKAAAGTIATALRAYIIEKAELEEGGAADIGEIVIPIVCLKNELVPWTISIKFKFFLYYIYRS